MPVPILDQAVGRCFDKTRTMDPITVFGASVVLKVCRAVSPRDWRLRFDSLPKLLECSGDGLLSESDVEGFGLGCLGRQKTSVSEW